MSAATANYFNRLPPDLQRNIISSKFSDPPICTLDKPELSTYVIQSKKSIPKINEEILDSAIDSIDGNIGSLKELQSELESIIKYQEECKEVFERLKKISYRFEDFSNFDYCEIGFERGIFLITFGYK